jgi:hypothetical protein
MIAAYSWLVAGEIPSQRLRSHTFGIAAAIGFLGAWLITFTAPYFINPSALNWGPRYGYIWFPSCIVTAVWVYFFLPETKGRTLEEIDTMVCIPRARLSPDFRLIAYRSSRRTYRRRNSADTISRRKSPSRKGKSRVWRLWSNRPRRSSRIATEEQLQPVYTQQIRLNLFLWFSS